MHLADNIDLTGGVVGGLILAASSSLLLYTTGKITGISGIFENIIIGESFDGNFAYILGLCSAGIGLASFKPDAFGPVDTSVSPLELTLAGVLVGFGTRLGSGCTSGHGLCGISRLSPRSLAAVGTFMTSGAITSYISHNTNVLASLRSYTITHNPESTFKLVFAAELMFLCYNAYFWFQKNKIVLPSMNLHSLSENFMYFTSAAIFGLGLGISGMCSPKRVTSFLNFSGASGWDPTLAGVMGSGVILNLITNWYLHRSESTPVLTKKNIKHSQIIKMGTHEDNLVINQKLIVGSVLFGIGWGLSGVCPGPAIVAWAAKIPQSMYFIPALMTGVAFQDIYSSSKKAKKA